jgi:peptidoglycan LD-endopeptidase CwlK
MSYTLGTASRAELAACHPDLIRLVERAIQVTKQDFTVHDGARTIKEQKEYVARGVSKTMNSRHLVNLQDGTGHAVDLVPWINGKLRFEWPPGYEVAKAMRIASIELNIPVTWGAIWDRRLADLDPDLEEEHQEYIIRFRQANGRYPFADCPHFQLEK